MELIYKDVTNRFMLIMKLIKGLKLYPVNTIYYSDYLRELKKALDNKDEKTFNKVVEDMEGFIDQYFEFQFILGKAKKTNTDFNKYVDLTYDKYLNAINKRLNILKKETNFNRTDKYILMIQNYLLKEMENMEKQKLFLIINPEFKNRFHHIMFITCVYEAVLKNISKYEVVNDKLGNYEYNLEF